MANNVLPKSDRLYKRLEEKEKAEMEKDRVKKHASKHAQPGRYGIREDMI